MKPTKQMTLEEKRKYAESLESELNNKFETLMENFNDERISTYAYNALVEKYIDLSTYRNRVIQELHKEPCRRYVANVEINVEIMARNQRDAEKIFSNSVIDFVSGTGKVLPWSFVNNDIFESKTTK